jgi:predicted enzyme related to lactoylglutathione lyase
LTVKSICGVILLSRDPDALARFYAEGLGLPLAREEHADLAPHWGVDIASTHFGIHPPENFGAREPGRGGVAVAFDVSSLAECQTRLARLGAACILPPHDEGFGRVATFLDPEGNPFEVVELSYRFGTGGAERA